MLSDYLIQRRKEMIGLVVKEEEKKIYRIKSASKKRGKQNREYLNVRKQYLINHPRCEVKGCNHVSEHIHHKIGRIGDLLTDSSHFLAVCSNHHTQIENHPNWAKEQDYSQSRLKK